MPSPPPISSPQPSQDNALVCIVDDDESVRRSLARLFRSVNLAAETFASAREYLQREKHSGPCSLVLDLRMPGFDGLRLQKALADRDAQIVFLTGHGEVPTCSEAMKAGAVDFLTKPVDDSVLLEAVSRALARSFELRQADTGKNSARARLATLTPRELEVLQCVITGLLNKQIAIRLGAAEKTIKIHRGRVMQKMKVVSVAELVRVAEMAGIAPAAVESLP